jgi:hypothetical protein
VDEWLNTFSLAYKEVLSNEKQRTIDTCKYI